MVNLDLLPNRCVFVTLLEDPYQKLIVLKNYFFSRLVAYEDNFQGTHSNLSKEQEHSVKSHGTSRAAVQS